jgi:hypothetical protein
VLATADPERHLSNLKQLRDHLAYRRILQYHSTDRFKVECAKSFLAYYLREPDLRFAAIVCKMPAKNSDVLASRYVEIIKSMGVPSGSLLYVKGKGSERGIRTSALLKSRQIGRVIAVRKEKSNALSQVADLFAGSILRDATPSMGADRRDSMVKSDLNLFLRNRLQVKRLDQNSQGKWNVRPLEG